MKSLVFIFLVVLSSNLWGLDVKKKSFRFGIAPFKDIQQMKEDWEPLEKHLEKFCDCDVHFEIAKSKEAFESRMKEAKYDLVFVDPFQQEIAEKSGFISLAREKNRSLQGVIITRKDSKIKSLEELANQKITFSKFHPFETSALIKKELEEKKISYEALESINLDFVVQNVIMGIATAGGINQSTFDEQDKEDKDLIRILDKTKKIPSVPFYIKKKLAKKTKINFYNALIDLNKSSEGRTLLKKLKLKKLS